MRKRKNGFSIISVMVAAVLIGFLSIVLVQLLSNSRSGQQTAENTVEFSVLKASIQNVLLDPDICATAFIDGAATPNPLTYLDDSGPYPSTALQSIPKIRIGDTATSPIIAEIGKRLGGGLTITSMGFRQLASQQVHGAKFAYKVALEINANKGTGAFGGPALSNANNPYILTIVTDSTSNVIESCSIANDEDCPAFMTKIGAGRGSFCIDTAPRPAADLWESINNCAQLATGSYGPARICSATEWRAACFSGGVPGMPVPNENIEPDTYAGTWGGWRRGAVTTCDGFTNILSSGDFPYRCCLY